MQTIDPITEFNACYCCTSLLLISDLITDRLLATLDLSLNLWHVLDIQRIMIIPCTNPLVVSVLHLNITVRCVHAEERGGIGQKTCSA